MSVEIKICTPEKVVLTASADKVVLPVMEGTLTIIHERAPRLQILTLGAVVLLDEHNREIKKYQISGGLADIALDVCTLAVQGFEQTSDA